METYLETNRVKRKFFQTENIKKNQFIRINTLHMLFILLVVTLIHYKVINNS